MHAVAPRLLPIVLAVASWSCGSASGEGVLPPPPPSDAAAETTFSVGDASPPSSGAIYASTQTSLHVLDPISTSFAKIGDFDCVVAPVSGASQQGMADIAANANGELFGVGMLDYAKDKWALVAIDTKTAHCTVRAPLAETIPPIGLTFLPKNTVGPDEVLVGLELDGTFVRYDLATGQRTPVGKVADFGCKASDIVSIEGGETYVAGCVGGNPHLYAIDPKKGAVVREVGSLPSTDFVGGLGFWAGTVYAFLSDGTLWSIDTKNGTPTQVAVTGGAKFWGAAVTTKAPLFAPK